MMNESLSGQDIIDNIATAIVVMDDSLRICSLNVAAEILFEMSQRQALNIPFQTLLPGENEMIVSLERVKQTGQALIEHEVRLYIPSTGEIIVDCAIKLVEVDEYQQYILLELTQLDFQQRISRDESLHTQQQVLRGLAHEIKNPLGGLRGAAQLLERQLESDDLKEYTSIIISEADRLQNLMTKMLGSHHRSDSVPVNIHQVLQHVRQLVLAEIDHRLTFIGDYDPSIPDLMSDFDQLVQVFLNLIQNAVQAMHGAGHIVIRTRVQRNISIEKRRYRLGVCIDIEDNGPGISKSLQETMFFPLVTGRAEGTGLGLYLVQNLVHRNNGAISCLSQPGKTVFSVVFPLENMSEK
ncbi:MAG: PAS domain-containing sensor histidine kinase [Methylophaga sp.]|nr:MAG: PAS domain-containing sensor histidine kinase [Methylophaga sp.]